MNKNATRMLTGLILGLIVLYSIIWGGIWLALMVTVFMCLGAKEYVKILEHKGFYPSLKIIIVSDLFLAIIAYLKQFDLVSIALTGCSMLAFLWVLFRGRQPYIANVATTILGFVYCGGFPLHLICLRDLHSPAYESGLGFVIMMFTSILLTDIGCYYVGTRFGKHKLAPIVSPNKTIEGSLANFAVTEILCLLFTLFINIKVYQAIILGGAISCFSQLGDLTISTIKRDLGLKHSSGLFYGYGGILDRLDAFIFSAPVAYYLLILFTFF